MTYGERDSHTLYRTVFRRLTPRVHASRSAADLVERTRHHRGAGGSELGTRGFKAAIEALRSIEESPGIGSPKIGELIGVPEVRRIGVDAEERES